MIKRFTNASFIGKKIHLVFLLSVSTLATINGGG
ncbi:hypothetical protein SAMN05660206_10386 [Sphingobacterium wenxiniae]|uniref:Uncharacterized protein n=1 Tax=Sphingobacterium wenxiniae TaxID=683125 RepID=A0A1I6R546_9SPHI|nr:hypothetical protein SAMN05660206_10386 [Sphingobacterium wenxiniae]